MPFFYSFSFYIVIFLATLSTTNQYRKKLKSRSLPPSSRVQSAPISSNTIDVNKSASYSLPNKNQLKLPLENVRTANNTATTANNAASNAATTIKGARAASASSANNNKNVNVVPNFMKNTKASAQKGAGSLSLQLQNTNNSKEFKDKDKRVESK